MSNNFKEELSLSSEQWKDVKKSVSNAIFDNYDYYNEKYNNPINQNYLHNTETSFVFFTLINQKVPDYLNVRSYVNRENHIFMLQIF